MEDIRDLYTEPYDACFPRVCFDERLDQVVSEVRQPLPVAPGHPARYDYEYRRQGTCNLFMCCEPLGGWRHVKVTDRRTAQDFAHGMQDLVDVHFPQATVISVVLDNLNTHTLAALYATFPPPKRAVSCGSWISITRPSMAAGSIWRKSSGRSWRPSAWTGA